MRRLPPAGVARAMQLLDAAPAARVTRDAESGWAYLLAYIQVFNGVKLPPEVCKEIIAKAEAPESVFRYRRWAVELLRRRRTQNGIHQGRLPEGPQTGPEPTP